MLALVSHRRLPLAAALAALLGASPAAAATPAGQPPAALAASAETEARMIFFRNECREAIEVAIHYQALDETWRMSRWLMLAPGDERPVGRTKADVYYSTARKDGATMPIPGRKARAVVYGDQAPTLFGVRSLETAGAGAVLQVFRCARK